MGMDDRDDSYRSRGPAPRRRPYDDADAPGRSGPRDMSGPRSRPPRRDYDDQEGGYDRPTRGPSGGSSGGSSNGRGDGRYERRPRPDDSGRGPRRGNGYDGYDRPSRSGGSDPNASYARGSRGGRPPVRDDSWDDARPSYGGRGPNGSDGRIRRVAPGGGRGGMWGDEGPGGGAARDIRSRFMANQQDDDEEDEGGSPAAGMAKALGAIVLALALGVGAAYGYYVLSAPKLQATPYQPPVPTKAPTVAPTPSATATGFIQLPAGSRTLLVG